MMLMWVSIVAVLMVAEGLQYGTDYNCGAPSTWYMSYGVVSAIDDLRFSQPLRMVAGLLGGKKLIETGPSCME